MHSLVRVLLNGSGLLIGKKRKGIKKVDPLRVFWVIWRGRNGRTFEDKDRYYFEILFSGAPLG